MLNGMGSKRVRVDAGTYEQLERLAAEFGGTVGTTVALAVSALRRERIADELSTPLRREEARWLDVDLG